MQIKYFHAFILELPGNRNRVKIQKEETLKSKIDSETDQIISTKFSDFE